MRARRPAGLDQPLEQAIFGAGDRGLRRPAGEREEPFMAGGEGGAEIEATARYDQPDAVALHIIVEPAREFGRRQRRMHDRLARITGGEAERARVDRRRMDAIAGPAERADHPDRPHRMGGGHQHGLVATLFGRHRRAPAAWPTLPAIRATALSMTSRQLRQ